MQRTAPLMLEVSNPTGGTKTIEAGDITFDPYESDSLIPPIREAAKKAQAAGMEVVGFQLAGEYVRYMIDAEYSDNSGNWVEDRSGTCEAEAALHGLMTMAANEGVDDVFLELLDAAEGMRVNHCAPQPVTMEEYRDAICRLVSEVRAAGHEGPALDEVVGLLRKDRVEVEDLDGPAAPRM